MEHEDQSESIEREELASEYANNVLLETSVWDIKLFFGQWYQSKNGQIDWHTAVTIPWAQAKLLAHYLRVNIAVHELIQGKIAVPRSLFPDPNANTTATEEDPIQIQVLEIIRRMSEEFVVDNKYEV